MKSHLGLYAALNQQVRKLSKAQILSCENVSHKIQTRCPSHRGPLVAGLLYLVKSGILVIIIWFCMMCDSDLCIYLLLVFTYLALIPLVDGFLF